MVNKKAITKKAEKELKANEEKWTKTLMDAGWTAFPSVILEKQHALGLSSTDINIILYLSTHWWEAERKPYPSKNTIAKALGVTSRTIQKRIASLEGAGFIRREYRQHESKGNDSNKYHLDGLIEACQKYALEKIEVREEHKAAEKKRRTRVKPVLKSDDKK